MYDKKTLKFQAFFKQTICESQIEHFRTRFVNIFYFLEDDTIIVIEPEIDVSIFHLNFYPCFWAYLSES